MTEDGPKQDSPDPTDSAPANPHRPTITPIKSTSSKQHSQSRSKSPALNNKKKRDGSEASCGGAELSKTTSQQLGSSSDATAPSEHLLPPALSAPQVSSSSIGRSPSMASINPSDSQKQANHSNLNDRESTLPAAGGDAGAVVWRSQDKLAACLACDLCHEVLRDPVTAPECMHSFCRDCIDQHVLYGGTKNICPVCKATDLQTVFGPQPFQHGKLQFDPMLADMIRKLFPRAEVEKGIQERQDAEAKFRASLLPAKKAKTALVKSSPQVASARVSSPQLGAAPAASGLPAAASSVQPGSVNLPQAKAGPAANARGMCSN